MAFQLSPAVDVKEIDLTSVIPAVSTTVGGFAGLFQWGPIGQRVSINSENQLVRTYGKPTNENYAHWFTAANFLGYSNNLLVVRVVDSTSNNATTGVTGYNIVKNSDDYNRDFYEETGQAGYAFIAKYPGPLGNALRISASDETHVNLDPIFADPGATGITEGALSTSTSTSTFYHVSTNTAVTGQDLLRFGRGTPQTITGWTGAVSLSTFKEAGVSLGLDAAAGITFTVTPGTKVLATGDILTTVKSGVRGFAEISALTQTDKGAGATALVTIGASGFGFAAGTVSAATDEVLVCGQVTSGATFASAGGTFAQKLWKYYNEFSQQLPATSTSVENQGGANDLLHVIVIDEDGDWTGTKNSVLEKFESVSKSANVKNFEGAANYYKTVINENSNYIWWGNHLDEEVTPTAGAEWGTESTSAGVTWATLSQNFYASMTGGSAGAPSDGDYYTDGFDQFADSETVDVSLIVAGPTEGNSAQTIVDMCDARKDCVAFFSPAKSAVLTSSNAPKSSQIATANTIAYRLGINGSERGGDVDFTSNNLNKSSSFAFMDCGWKYMYDRYNDVFRWVPLNGDTAGLAARSDEQSETWFSPAGYNRGQLRNVVKLAYNPGKPQRDDLYSDQINPVISAPGEGTVLFGDKTLLSKPSAFDRLNVRRLFIVLEKAISTASKFALFEQNDAFTRASFRNLVEPFLRDVQARRGVIDFKVICDETNNTAEVVDRNEFVADIFIKPAKSVNFITLNFVATRTGVDFNELGGAV